MCSSYQQWKTTSTAISLLHKDLKLGGCIRDPNDNKKGQLSFVCVKHQYMRPKDRAILKMRLLTVLSGAYIVV